MDSNLKNWLKKNNIDYILHQHPPVYTVPEAKEFCGHIPGRHIKNMFMQDSITKQFFLVSIPSENRLDMKKFRKLMNFKKIRFASAENLKIHLGLTPGAVSPLGLINNIENNVIFIVDEVIWEAEKVVIHPNVNNESLELSQQAFHDIIKNSQNTYLIKSIPYEIE